MYMYHTLLLFCTQGTEGKYILVRQSSDGSITPYTFQVDRSLDTSLQELVNRILPICNNYSTVMHFIEDKSSFEFGVVNHALCGAMRTLVKVGAALNHWVIWGHSYALNVLSDKETRDLQLMNLRD